MIFATFPFGVDAERRALDAQVRCPLKRASDPTVATLLRASLSSLMLHPWQEAAETISVQRAEVQ
jgi:hypothetical protein